MTSTKNIVLLLTLVFTMWSCDKEQNVFTELSDKHSSIYQELLSIEHSLLISDYDLAINHSENLDTYLKDGYNLFCPTESGRIDGIRLTNQILVQHIENKETTLLLDDLRLLKAMIIRLKTDDDYDPYFAFLWRFEEVMNSTTEIAMDPMLDLYEWNEFNSQVDCMIEAWQPVVMHYPSPEILHNDHIKFKNQTVYKVYLQHAVENFHKAALEADYKQYPLCESAEEVRKAYIEYINTFLQNPVMSDSFLAKL